MALEQVGGEEQTSGITRLTLEHLYWKITSNNDLSNATAEVAFKSNSVTEKPIAEDWTPATILQAGQVPGEDTAKAVRVLVGPGGAVTLTPATDDPETYRVWIKISIHSATDPEITEQAIVRRVGTLVVR